MSTIAYYADTGQVSWPTQIASGADEALTLLVLRLRAPLGGYPADQTIGLPLDAWATRRPTPEAVEATVRAQTERDDRLSVRTLSATVTGGEVSVTLGVDVDDGDSTITAQVSGRLYGVDAVSSWYVTGMIGVSR